MGEEIDELVGIAYVRGWKSSRAEKGEILREKIQNLTLQQPKEQLYTLEQMKEYGNISEWNGKVTAYEYLNSLNKQ